MFLSVIRNNASYGIFNTAKVRNFLLAGLNKEKFLY